MILPEELKDGKRQSDNEINRERGKRGGGGAEGGGATQRVEIDAKSLALYWERQKTETIQ